MKTMTFKAWQATRCIVTRQDDSDIFDDAELDCDEVYSYGGGNGELGYIERHTLWAAPKNGVKQYAIKVYLLVIENMDWMRTDLISLEEILYEFEKDIGNLDIDDKNIPFQRRQRLLMITNNALEQFWRDIAEGYEELKTGDLGPTATLVFEQAAYKVVTTWRDNNGGGQKV